jgi:DNA-binding beta-propeller fold protein YncE/cytochrome c
MMRQFLLGIGALGSLVGGALLPRQAQEAPAPSVKLAREGNRGPYEVAFTPDGKLALVTEYDEGALAVLDRATGKVLRHLPTGGTQPTGVAVTPDGALALVTNSFSGSVAFINLKINSVETLPLRGMPWDVVITRDGKRAFVSVSQLNQVAVIELGTRKITATLPTGHRPQALALTEDGTVLVAANLTAGTVSYFDTASLAARGTAKVPSVNLRGVAAFANGRHVFAVGQRAQNERPTETPIGIWSNQAFVQVPGGPRNGVENLWLDLMGTDVSDPDSVVLDAREQLAYITCSGGDSVNVVPVDGEGETRTVAKIGAHPRGLAFTPDQKELWVANLLGNDLAVLDPITLKILRRISLGPTVRKDPSLLGRYLFGSAKIVNGEQFSCNSCHPDGGTDGISWKFVHVPDVLGKQTDRNAKALRGNLAGSAPYRWSGHEPTLRHFVEGEIKGLLQTPTITEAEKTALIDYVGALPEPPNPYRTTEGGLTSAALRGRLLFEGKAACAACHSGSQQGGQRQAWVGTTPQGVSLQVPRLKGVYDTAPYLHNGKARTLEEVFSQQNASNLHGKLELLSAEEQKDLLEYVREL